jgi:hypothetical protein
MRWGILRTCGIMIALYLRFVRCFVMAGFCMFNLSLFLGTLSCRRSEPAPSFITQTGRFAYFDGGLKIEVSEAANNRIEYRIAHGIVSVGPGSSTIQKGSAWFIHPATPNSIWIYDGTSDLLLIEVSENGATKFTSAKVIPDLTNRAPPEVMRRVRNGV